MARKRKPTYDEDGLPDFETFLSCPFMTDEWRAKCLREMQEILHGPQPDPPEPMPKTPDGGDIFRAHALGVRLDGKWSQHIAGQRGT
jgi:hypothetical protein